MVAHRFAFLTKYYAEQRTWQLHKARDVEFLTNKNKEI